MSTTNARWTRCSCSSSGTTSSARRSGSSKARGGTEMTLVGACLHDLGDLSDGEAELVVGVVVVRPEPKAGIGAEVAQDLAFGELCVHCLELGRADGDGAAATRRV